MKKFAVLSSLITILSSGAAFADFTLVCKTDAARGGRSEQDVKVTGNDVNNLRQACAVMKSDPQYSEYNWQTCIDKAGKQGTCLDPADPPPAR